MNNVIKIMPGQCHAFGEHPSNGQALHLFTGLALGCGVYRCVYAPGHPETGVTLAVSASQPGGGRLCVAMNYLRPAQGPGGWHVANAGQTVWAEFEELGQMLTRQAALEAGHALVAFMVADTVLDEDRRLAAALLGTEPGAAGTSTRACHMSQIAFARPDAVIAQALAERRASTVENNDYCVLGGARFFLRCNLSLPRHGHTRPYLMGLWAEVPQAGFDQERASGGEEGAAITPPIHGVLANDIRGLPTLVGQPVALEQRGPRCRPALRLLDAEHPLAIEQLHGISSERYGQYSNIALDLLASPG